jgi:hypothetical protein
VWTKQWYPLAVVDDLNPQKPFATKLLGALLSHVLLHITTEPQRQYANVFHGCRQGHGDLARRRGRVALLPGHVPAQVRMHACARPGIPQMLVHLLALQDENRTGSAPDDH